MTRIVHKQMRAAICEVFSRKLLYIKTIKKKESEKIPKLVYTVRNNIFLIQQIKKFKRNLSPK